ncbi:hypothetical protein BDW02DRAFT_635110 [Decorospora gaudefroyi]|uniref:Osmotin, thaumatin-like protein n=1 Tax=Decorospora gaudefroyi TaxID=184978 RepID=A0A6A5JVQ4_9PLEO|nr:hypothetical protein BDW02DRAFT_635110 [Decorospora gaudefroyi]
MLPKIAFTILALTSTLVLAGNTIIANRCPYDIWLWSISTDNWGAPIHIPAYTKHTSPFRTSPTSLKISKTDQLILGKHTQFEYSIVDNQLWYDISFVDCANGQSASDCPGHDEGLVMDTTDGRCGRAECTAGAYCPTQAYYVDTPLRKLGIEEPVFTCPGAGTDMDLYMRMCASMAPVRRSVAGRVVMDGEE